MVAKLLEKAFNEAAKLSDEEQRQLAAWILAELESENEWARAFSNSQDELAQLAEEALQAAHGGQAEDLDPKEL